MQSNSKADPLSYNSRLIELTLQLVKIEYPQIEIDRLLTDAGLKIYEVSDPGCWFGREVVDRFIDLLIEQTGNERLPRDAGRYAASSQVIGPMRQKLFGQVHPEKVLGLIHRASRNFTRGVDYQMRMLADNRVEVTVTPSGGVSESAHLCAYRRGFFEELIRLFNVAAPSLSHPECLNDGGGVCRYLISWRERRSARWSRLRGYAIAALLLLNLLGYAVVPHLSLSLLIPLSVLSLLLLIPLVGGLVKKDLKNEIALLQQSTENLLDELDVSYNNSQLVAEIGQALSNRSGVDGILEAVTRIMQERLDYDRGGVLLTDAEAGCLRLRAHYGVADSLLEGLRERGIELDHPDTKGIFLQALNERSPLLVEDVAEIEAQLSLRGRQLTKELGSRSFISCPIVCDGESIGVLLVDNVHSQRPLRKNDVVLLKGLASIVGVSIHNARLLKQRSEQFHSLLQVLSASIDARDFLTAGHSERVTTYSVEICRELGLSDEDTEVIRVAALLHDYGKIGVPDFILKKEGLLSGEERALVETHPAKTREILERIHFEGIYRPVPQIAGGHHEKFDGSGYPYGLKGEEIPLGARIIAVADFFEAITAKRHYRGPMSLELAMEELRAGSGTHFDPDIVAALMNYVAANQESLAEENDDKIQFFHRHVRVPCRCQVSGKAEKRTISGSSVNLSVGGMFVAGETLLEKGDPVELVFTLPTFPERLVSCNGRVAWVNPPEKISALPIGFGVQFVDLPAEEAEVIKGLVGRVFAAPLGAESGF